MAIWAWVLIAAAVVVIVIIAAVIAAKRRSTKLRQQFGPEYERAIQDREGRRAAESELRNRQKQHAQLDIRPLPEQARAGYAEQWRELQERFIDEPANAVLEADALVRQVMNEEGYPVEDFNQQADLVSVDHPHVVENYRIAHTVCERTQAQQASTEDMRTALVRYRSLFDELLHKGSGDAYQSTPDGGPRHRLDGSGNREAGGR